MSPPAELAAGAPMLIAACGNVYAGDDAFGPLAARRLRSRALANVEVAELDLRPAGLIDFLLTPRRTLIVVDAVSAVGRTPGEIVDVDWRAPDRPALTRDDVLSTHGLSIANQIEFAENLGILPPRVRLIGAVIEAAIVGQLVMGVVVSAVDDVVERIVRFVEDEFTDGVRDA